MKNLDLNAFCVHEMGTGEMKENNGGKLIAWIIGAISGFIYESATNPKDTAKAFSAGATKATQVEI